MKLLNTLIALICISASTVVFAQETGSRALATLISELERADFTNITATERFLGGIVVEAKQNDKAVLIALSDDSFNVEYVEVFESIDATGFFGLEKRPPGTAIENIISRYNEKLDRMEARKGLSDNNDYLTNTQNHNRTAGFSQSRTLSVQDDRSSVVFRNSESLGVLTNRTYVQENSFSMGEDVSQTITERASITSSQFTSSIQMAPGDGFNSEVFTNQSSYRANIQESTNTQLPKAQSLRSDIINQIAENTSETIVDAPNNNLFNMTNEIRQLINQNLQNQN